MQSSRHNCVHLCKYRTPSITDPDVFEIMSAEKVACDLFAFALGVFYLSVSLLGVFGKSPRLGTFGARFTYEMQEIMGGLIGVPNYMMIESVALVVTAWGCLKCVSFPPPSDHMPGISLTLALGYCLVVLAYGCFSGSRVAYFVPVFLLTVGQACWRFARFTAPRAERPIVIAAILSSGLAAVAIYRMYKRKDLRREINERFLRMLKYLDKNPAASWQLGKDAPEGFEDAESATLLQN